MNISWLLIPCMLMARNPVDFRDSGASECYANCLNQLVTHYIEVLEDNNPIKLINKTGHLGEKICSLELQFEYYDQLDMVGARQMMLQLIDSFVQAINSSERLKPYLPCPFTEDNISIRVNFVSQCKFSYPQPGQIKYMSYIDGMISYRAENPRLLGSFVCLRDEPICFARRIALPFPPPGCVNPNPRPGWWY